MSEYRNGASQRAHNSDNPTSKPGSRSPKHRGHRPDAAAPAKKPRWNADDRAARGTGGDRARGARPDWQPREDRGTGRGGAARTGDRTDRYGDRSARTDRFGDRPQRGYDRGDRTARPQGDRGDRFNDRPQRGFERGTDRGYDRGDRFADRPQRDFADRADRGDRGDRPQRGFDRADRADRTDRPARSPQRDRFNDRPQREGYRDDRPQRGYGDRPQHGGDRDRFSDRAPRTDRFDRADRTGDRPQRFDRDARPDRDARADRTDRFAGRDDRGERRSRPDWTPRGDGDQRARRDYSDRPRRDFDERPSRESSFYPSKDARGYDAQDDVVLEKLEAAMTTADEVVGVSFVELGLGGNISRALAELGASSPFPIQAATIPDVLAGRDVLGRGRTGSGKTIAFGAPLVEQLLRSNAPAADRQREPERDGGRRQRRVLGRKPRALILAPTRELALQIDRTVQPIARSVGLFTTQIYGGVPQARQVGALQRGVDIVIGTPGRIEDLIEQGRLDLSEVQVTVLDEADHMCDLGFLEPVQRIIRRTSPDGQKLLFSATLDTGVAALVNEFLTDPAVHEVAGEDQASSTIDHRVLLIEHREKGAIIEQLAAGEGKKLIFTRTRAFAEQLAEMLEDADIPAVSLHGDLNQSRRTRNLERLTSGRVNVLVATDVAARGIHVDDIALVIQADAPDEYKTYLHRAGRTGRAGKQGTVVTLVARNRRRKVDSLLERAEIAAEYTSVIPGDELLDELANVGA